MTMPRVNDWTTALDELDSSVNESLGYQLLYCPWSKLATMRTLFISLNPGCNEMCRGDRYTERADGNCYVTELEDSPSPINVQFIELCKLMGEDPSDVVPTVLNPLRTYDWDSMSADAQRRGNELGLRFIDQLLDMRPERIITVSSPVEQALVEHTRAKLTRTLSSGWGNVKLREYRTSNGTPLYSLPHISRFRLLSRESCKPHLRELLGVAA